MNKEELTCLIGKYLNGYKIVKVENDPFIKGQINLFTDEWEYEAFNDRALVKFYVRNDSNTSKIYKELVDKENHNLKQALIDIREICNYYGITPQENDNVTLRHILKDILQIIDKTIGDDENEKRINYNRDSDRSNFFRNNNYV